MYTYMYMYICTKLVHILGLCVHTCTCLDIYWNVLLVALIGHGPTVGYIMKEMNIINLVSLIICIIYQNYVVGLHSRYCTAYMCILLLFFRIGEC